MSTRMFQINCTACDSESIVGITERDDNHDHQWGLTGKKPRDYERCPACDNHNGDANGAITIMEVEYHPEVTDE